MPETRFPTIGVLGGGQLGRMLALAGLPLGLRFRFLENDPDCPAADVGEVIAGRYDDPAALERFASGVHVATYEFENVPAATARWLTEHVPVFPPEGVLAIAQDRLGEKTLFRELGIGTPEFAAVNSFDQLDAALSRIGLPCVLKTRRFGYDGKGQWVLRDPAEVAALPADLWSMPSGGLILEAFVPFARELSIIGVRSRTGQEVFYPLTQNTHREGVLRESIAPAPGLTDTEQARAEEIARRILDRTGYVGVLTIELFELAGGTLLANEMAPRVHNSGHWTMDAAPCSQFENHLRAIMGWPLGPTRPHGVCAAMLNILRDLPDPALLLSSPGLHLHLYGKQPRAGQLRKAGHVNIVASTHAELQERASAAKQLFAASL
jgi:5-(carboxyamino)imidazole ribonucleotide synthase